MLKNSSPFLDIVFLFTTALLRSKGCGQEATVVQEEDQGTFKENKDNLHLSILGCGTLHRVQI